MQSKCKYITANELANILDISESSLYRTDNSGKRDMPLKERILKVIQDNPTYGHKRIALELGLNKKHVLRVMKKYGIKPIRVRAKKPNYSYTKSGCEYKNLIKNIFPICPYYALATDFTYLPFKGAFLYLATVIDIFNREILGYALSVRHTDDLVVTAIKTAVSKCPVPPLLIHFDQGAEYMSSDCINFLNGVGIQISVSAKGSPWENGYKEAFYSQFKLDIDAKHLDRFKTIGEVAEYIYQMIWYHNNKRIHTKLKTNPVEYKKRYFEKLSASTLNSNINCERIGSQEMGT